MLPTGGTTGHPKVARLTNRAMVASTVSSRMALDFHRGERAMITMPLFHVGGLFCTTANSLAAGTTMVIPGPAGARDPALVRHFWQIIEKYRINIAGNVPTILGALADIPVADSDISTLRVTATGASICPPEIERRYLATWGGPCIQQLYGMTELAGAITHDVHGVKPRAESVGTRNPLVELAILDGGKLHTGPWPSPVGELLTRGPQVFAGYVDKKQTEEVFRDGWLRTGDIATIDEYGYLRLVDRTKDLIKSGGEWISSIEVENHLMDHPEVAQAMVIAVAHPVWTERPAALVVRRAGSAVTASDLAAHLGTRVASWWVPDVFEFVEALPTTATGKFDKKHARATWGPTLASQVSAKESST
jgi:fatty-acyl-CoA synthase